MTVIEAFELVRVSAADEDPYKAPQSRLLRHGVTTGLTIDGARLDAQFAIEDEFLLLVTDDTPYEETMRAYLLDRQHRIIDSAHLGFAYTAAVLRRLRMRDSRSVTFDFSRESSFRLTVHPAPRHFWNAAGGLAEAVRVLKGRRLEITRERATEQEAR